VTNPRKKAIPVINFWREAAWPPTSVEIPVSPPV
jgi:hypothetical protein